jgi:hypothetical protein
MITSPNDLPAWSDTLRATVATVLLPIHYQDVPMTLRFEFPYGNRPSVCLVRVDKNYAKLIVAILASLSHCTTFCIDYARAFNYNPRPVAEN